MAPGSGVLLLVPRLPAMAKGLFVFPGVGAGAVYLCSSPPLPQPQPTALTSTCFLPQG